MLMHANTNRRVDTTSAVSVGLSWALRLHCDSDCFSVSYPNRQVSEATGHDSVLAGSHRMGLNQFPAFSGPQSRLGQDCFRAAACGFEEEGGRRTLVSCQVFQYEGTGCRPDRASRVNGCTDGNLREYGGKLAVGYKPLLLRQSVGLIFTLLLSYFWFYLPFSFTPAFRPAHNCFCFFCSHTVRSLTVYINRIPEQQRRMEKAHMEAVCLDLCKEPVRTIYNRSVLHSRCSHYQSLTAEGKTAQTLI